MFAAERGKLPALRILLDAKADVNLQDDTGSTVLHRAIRAAKEEVSGGIDNCIRELIQRGTNLSIRKCG